MVRVGLVQHQNLVLDKCWFVVRIKGLIMKKVFICVVLLFAVVSLSAQMTVSGILDSTVAFNAGAADSPNFSYGIEEYANIRFQSRLRDSKGAVHGAVNLIAASGDYAANAALMAGYASLAAPVGFNSTPYVAGQNFISAIELERLFFRLRGEHVDFDGGLMRLPFGYGQVWGPSDFLNPRNPLKPDARPRAILGGAFTWYPIDELKLLGFYASPRDAFSNEGNGSFFGFSMDRHWENSSVQTLYSFEIPKTGSANGIHRIGLSLKADIEIGFVMETLYTYNHEAGTDLNGLSFSVGADYSFADGNLMVLTEYLYNGHESSTAFNLESNILGQQNTHNIYAGITWRINDFTSLNSALIASFDSISYVPFVSLNHELFQGATLTVSVQVPFDNDDFYGVACTARIRIRF